ncbi:MAG: hypothetical protein IKT08_06495 [Bacteroidales bacterium]|nr:hypothetical protein [Bacteroidales bacterium]
MKKILFLLLTLLSVLTVIAQNKGVIHGRCIDLRKQPIQGVNIYSVDSLLLSVSDKNGNFTVNKAKVGDTLCLSHLTYEYTRFVIEKEDFSKKEVPIMMLENAYSLLEVDIIGSAPVLAYRNKVNSLIDYEFNDLGFYMIAYRQDESCSLLHLSMNFDTLSVLPIRRKFQRLYKDVYDQIHLIGPDSTYQIGHRQYRGQYMNMELFYGMRLEEFYAMMGNNVLANDEVFIVADYGDRAQEIYYNYYEIGKPDKGYFLDYVANTGGLDMAENYRKFGGGGDLLFLKVIYDPVFESNDTIFLFNFEADKIIYFNHQAQRIGSGWLTFHRERTWDNKWQMRKDWKRLVLLDKEKAKFYAVFEENGVMVLKKINTNTGKADEVARLNGFTFVFNPQVRDGMLYFLYSKEDNHAKQLYRMKID